MLIIAWAQSETLLHKLAQHRFWNVGDAQQAVALIPFPSLTVY